MTIISQTLFAIKCDNCEKYSGDGTGYMFWLDKESAETSAMESEFIEHKGKHYCSDCWEWNDDDELIIKTI